MRTWSSLAVVVAALVAAGAAVAADNPPGVYSDYATDGVLSCGHSRAALRGVLNDASIQQYGDPLTILGLKLAIRKQLAGGCRRKERATLPIGSAARSSGTTLPPTQPQSDEGSRRQPSGARPAPQKPPLGSDGDAQAGALGAAGDGRDGWMVLLGVGLLLVTLGSGGWAARRAFNDEP
jgi:hypothetical protein